MKKYLILIAILLISITAFLLFYKNRSGLEQTETSESHLLSPEQVKNKMEIGTTRLIDVRTKEEFDAGHIKNAEVMDMRSADFSDQVSKLDSQKTYILYCKSGNRSSQAYEIFKKNGIVSVYELQGGITAWGSIDIEKS